MSGTRTESMIRRRKSCDTSRRQKSSTSQIIIVASCKERKSTLAPHTPILPIASLRAVTFCDRFFSSFVGVLFSVRNTACRSFPFATCTSRRTVNRFSHSLFRTSLSVARFLSPIYPNQSYRRDLWSYSSARLIKRSSKSKTPSLIFAFWIHLL